LQIWCRSGVRCAPVKNNVGRTDKFRGVQMVEYFRVGLPYIRMRFKVPARRGGRVELQGRFGVITAASGEYLLVKFDGEQSAVIVHPVEPNYVESGEATEPPPVRQKDASRPVAD
jgi:hypothetical protein